MLHSNHQAYGAVHAKLRMPSSKTATCRALLLAALADGVSELTSLYLDDEIKTLIKALNQLGILVQLDEKTHTCIVAGGNGIFPKKQAALWYEESPMIANFLLAACALTTGVYFFDGSKSLGKNSMTQLIHILKRQGAQFIPSDQTTLPITLVGADSLEGGEMYLDKKVSSHLLSALLLIAPYARSASNFRVRGVNQDIDLTCTLMAEFGVLVHRVHHRQFMVPVPQRYQAKNYQIDSDFTLAPYLFAAIVLLEGEITLEATKQIQVNASLRKFLRILKQIGCKIVETEKAITLKTQPELQGIHCQLAHVNEPFLALCLIAPFLKTPTVIHYRQPKNKLEITRLAYLLENFKKLNIKVEQEKEFIKIFPSMIATNVTLSTYHDPKLAMMLTILGFKYPGITLDDNTIIDKTYPDFQPLFKMLLTTVSACA